MAEMEKNHCLKTPVTARTRKRPIRKAVGLQLSGCVPS